MKHPDPSPDPLPLKCQRLPRTGDPVHYVLSTGAHRPAIVLQPFSSEIVALHIFTFPGEDHTFSGRAIFDPEHMPGTWHYPET